MALSSAIAAGDPDPIATSVKMALRGGAAREEVYEALLQSYLFLGFPRARVRESIALCAPTAGAATVSEALRVAGLESQDARG